MTLTAPALDAPTDLLSAARAAAERGWPVLLLGPAGEPANGLDGVEAASQGREAARCRLHDARHTAATMLLILGVPERAVIGIMGWSDSGMAMRYQHLTAEIRHDIAKRWRAALDR